MQQQLSVSALQCGMQIRPARPDDAAALTQLYRASVTMLGVRDYSAEQVRVWATLAPSTQRFGEMMADGRLLLVAVDADARLLAFGDLETDGHIDYLYSAPFAAATGAAAALYAELECRARAAGLHRLYAEASEAARRFFLRRGFVVTARRDFEVDGVPIHNYAVEKRLA
jgi:putative acetyltransferase